MNFFASFLLLMFTYIIQTTVMGYVNLWNVKPDLLLTVIICYAIFEGKEKAVVFAMGAGMLLDFLWGKSFGVHTLILMLIALACSITADNVFHKNALLAVLCVFVFSLIYGLMLALVSGSGGVFFLLWRVAFPNAIYNTALAVPIFAFIGRLRERFESENF